MSDAGILAVVLAQVAAHGFAPLAFRVHGRFGRQSASFSGGIAVAYAFLHLLPELDGSNELLGRRVYGVVLLGFAFFYGVETAIQQQGSGSFAARIAYPIRLVMLSLYGFLLIFTVGLHMPESLMLAVVFAFALGLDTLTHDLAMLERYGARFAGWGRAAYLVAALLGYAATRVQRPREEVVDTATAVLAGFILYTALREELPQLSEASFAWFLAGAGLFVSLHVLLG
jgi:zinc transporter ZupT